jgi:hypothetical protein
LLSVDATLLCVDCGLSCVAFGFSKMLAASDVPPFARRVKIDDLPGGGGGIPLRRYKSEIYGAVCEHTTVLIDAATAAGKSKVVPDVIQEALESVDPAHCRLLSLTTSTIDVVEMQQYTKVYEFSLMVCVLSSICF